MNANPSNTDRDPAYGWVVVTGAALCMGLGNGALLTISVYLKPLVAEFGWDRGAISLAYMLGCSGIGVGGIAMGWLSDRLPTRWLILMAALTLVGVLYGLAHMSTLWEFYLLYTILGLVPVAACFSPLIALTGKWFTHRKGLALGITTAGQSLGYAVVPFLARHLITLQGWRDAYLTLAFLCGGLLFVAALLLREPSTSEAAKSPNTQHNKHGAGFLPARQTVAWLSTAAIFSMALIGTARLHMVPLIQDNGHAPQIAASVLSVLMVASLLGRLGFGRLADSIGGLRSVLLAAVGQTLVIYLFMFSSSIILFYLLGALFGVAYGAMMTCYMICLREMVPLRNLGTSVGILGLLGWVGIGLGGWQGGLLFDASGGYALPFAMALLAGVVNVGILLAFRWRLQRHASGLTPQTQSA